MDRPKAQTVDTELIKNARLNEKAPQKSHFSPRKRLTELWQRARKLPLRQIGLSIATVVIVVFLSITLYRRNNKTIAIKDALDRALSSRNFDTQLSVNQALYGGSNYKYSGTLSTRADNTMQIKFATTRNDDVTYNSGKLSTTELIAKSGKSYLKFSIDRKLSFSGVDYNKLNDKWYSFNGTTRLDEAALYTLTSDITPSSSFDPQRLNCAVSASNQLNNASERQAIIKALFESGFAKIGASKSNKHGRYYEISFDSDKYAKFAQAYSQTNYSKKVQGCLADDATDLFNSEIMVRETAERLKNIKPQIKLYLDGTLYAHVKRVELTTSGKDKYGSDLSATFDLTNSNKSIAAPSGSTALTDALKTISDSLFSVVDNASESEAVEGAE